MSGVGASSTTNHLAGQVPLEKTGSSDLPGSFPETPAAEPAGFSVNPLPATAGPGNPTKLAPGESVPHHSNLTANTVGSTATTDKEAYENSSALPTSEQTFGVAPIPATAGAGNPVKLAPGESVPHHSNFTANTVESTVTTDKASYEIASGSAPVLPPVVTPQAERDAKGAGVLDLPSTAGGIIPESSLPMGSSGLGTYDAGPTIASSAGPSTTTAALAGAVPLEPKTRVPEVVKESQKAAGVAPEASAVPSEVAEKSAVEKELLAEVPKAGVTSDGTALHSESPLKTTTGVSAGEAAAAVGAAAVAVGGAAVAAAYTAKDKTVEAASSANGGKGLQSYLPESVQNSINNINSQSTAKQTVAGGVPSEVKESLAEAHQSPEAAAYSEPVVEKAAVEKQLLSEIKKENSAGESAPKIGSTTAAVSAGDVKPAPLPTTTTTSTTPSVPAAVADKIPDKTTLAAPTTSKPADSRDVSPGTLPGTHSQTAPVVTSGVQSASTPAKSAAPATPTKATPASSKIADSPSTPTSKKDKRRSFFGKLKDKLKH